VLEYYPMQYSPIVYGIQKRKKNMSVKRIKLIKKMALTIRPAYTEVAKANV
jgi:hypothetical protein